MAAPEFIYWPDGTTYAVGQVIRFWRQANTVSLELSNDRVLMYSFDNVNLAAFYQASVNTLLSPSTPSTSGATFSLNPNHGPVKYGLNVILTANGFLFVDGGTVTINGEACVYIASADGTIAYITTPNDLALGNYDTVYTPPAGGSAITMAASYHAAAPIITAVVPDASPVVGAVGTTLKIVGANFSPTNTATIGTANLASPAFVNTTLVSWTLTGGDLTAGTYNTVVTDVDGNASNTFPGFVVT